MDRVLIAGISGAGKTTVARALGERLGVPQYELDALHHGSGWVKRAEFLDPDHPMRWAWSQHARWRGRVEARIATHPEVRVVRLRSRRGVRRWLESVG